MRTPFTSSIDSVVAHRRQLGAFVAAALVVASISSCEPSVTRLEQPRCRPNQFHACETDCGRGFTQCVEPGVWTPCSCTAVEAGFPDDVRVERDSGETSDADAAEPTDADAAETGETTDADAAETGETTDAEDAETGETTDADAAETGETTDAEDAAESGEPTDLDAGASPRSQSGAREG